MLCTFYDTIRIKFIALLLSLFMGRTKHYYAEYFISIFNKVVNIYVGTHLVAAVH